MASSEGSNVSTHLARLGSFKKWDYTHHPSPTQLAKAGLFHKGPVDLLECYACGVQLNKWKEGDDPVIRHKQAGPDCPYIFDLELNTLESDSYSSYASNTSVSSGTTSVASIDSAYHSNNPAEGAPNAMPRNGNQGSTNSSDVSSVIEVREGQRSSPRRRRRPPPEKFKKIDARLTSYHGVDWPNHLTVQPDNLAKAGFYYAGPDPIDRVKCGFCGGVLKNWLKNDIAIEEHRRHYPDCEFIKTVEKQTEALAKNINSKKSGGISSEELIKKNAAERKKKEQKDLNVQTLVAMGYSRALVEKAKHKAVQHKIKLDLTHLMPILQELERLAYLGEEEAGQESDEGVDEDLYQSDGGNDPSEGEVDNDWKKLQASERALRKEVEELKNQMTCKICLTNQIDTLFLTCRHFVTCKTCADKVKDCPVCRQLILGTVDVYIA